jgi:hypothetical protein
MEYEEENNNNNNGNAATASRGCRTVDAPAHVF